MSQIMGIEAFYKTDLRAFSRELWTLYWRWTKDITSNKPVSEHYSELRRLEFSIYNKTCEDVIQRSSEIAKSLERLIVIDTKQMNSAIAKAKRQKARAERDFTEERKVDEGIKMIKSALDDIFTSYSDYEENKKNFENEALRKWGGIILGVFSTIMLVYLGILNYTQIELPMYYVLGIPAIIAMFLILIVVAIFSRETPEKE